MITGKTVLVVAVFAALLAAVLLVSQASKNPDTPAPTPARTCDDTTQYGDLCVSPEQSS